jgi:RNA ligase-like protein
MEFRKYQHLERFGATEVSQIELGECYVFPKIDGSNASVWLDENGQVCAGSRTRKLSLESDNAGFYEWVTKQSNILLYLQKHPTHRLFGEWLVPHSLKTYRENAWRNFYVFDVCVDRLLEEVLHESDSLLNYLHFNEYSPLLDEFGINFIPPICRVTNSSYEQFVNQLCKNTYLIDDGKGAGEGIVIKNYEFKNRFNRQAFAKIVTSEFKEKHAKEFGEQVLGAKKMIEEEICDKFVTIALCEKVLSKIENEKGWSSKFIPQLLNTVFYDLVKEDCWEFVKEHRNPIINFKTLQHFCFKKVRENLQRLF